MTEQRIDPFANIGLDGFKPKGDNQRPTDISVVDKVSRDNNFPSREAPPAKPLKRTRYTAAAAKKQINIKVNEDCHTRFYAMAEDRGITLGDLLDLALDALEHANDSNRKST